MDIEAEDFQELGRRLEWVRAHHIEGKPIAVIAHDSKTTRQTVRKWIKRFEEAGLAGLVSSRKGGRPRRIPAWVRSEIVRLTTATRPPEALTEECRWTSRGLASVFGVSPARITGIWAEEGLVPPEHLQQVKRSPLRRRALKVELEVPAWLKLYVELLLIDRDWSIERYLLARLVDADPDDIESRLDELREDLWAQLPTLWSSAMGRLPEVDADSPSYRRWLTQNSSVLGRLLRQ